MCVSNEEAVLSLEAKPQKLLRRAGHFLALGGVSAHFALHLREPSNHVEAGLG